MAGRLSRRVLALWTANELLAGNNQALEQLAALLIDERREREADILVRDIEARLADMGHVVVQVESAHPLSETAKHEIETMFDGRTVHLHETVKPELVGGVRIMTPTQMLDGTIAKKLETLRMIEV